MTFLTGPGYFVRDKFFNTNILNRGVANRCCVLHHTAVLRRHFATTQAAGVSIEITNLFTLW